MKSIVRIGVPAVVSIILLVLYFILEKAEKLTKDKTVQECASENREGTMKKGEKCTVFKNGTCYKGTFLHDDDELNDITKKYEQLGLSIENANALTITQVCGIDEVYRKYDILLYFGIFFAVLAITMIFVDIKF